MLSLKETLKRMLTVLRADNPAPQDGKEGSAYAQEGSVAVGGKGGKGRNGSQGGNGGSAFVGGKGVAIGGKGGDAE
jgi:hypothetical protein